MQILLSSVSFGYMIQTCPARPPHPPILGRAWVTKHFYTNCANLCYVFHKKLYNLLWSIFAVFVAVRTMQTDLHSLLGGGAALVWVWLSHPPSPPTTLSFPTNHPSPLSLLSHQFPSHPLASYYPHFFPSSRHTHPKKYTQPHEVCISLPHWQSLILFPLGAGWHSGRGCNSWPKRWTFEPPLSAT